MQLTPQEVERFYSIWFPLLHYVNQQQALVPSFPAQWRDATVAPEVVLPLRDALWDNDALRQAFIAENPARLPQSDLRLVESWQHRVSGNFFIFRHLKKYSIFLSGEDPVRGFGVLGLTSAIEEVVGPQLPIYVKAVLLPFEDRIIYDSLLSSYPLLFGAGYRSSLNDTYRAMQERGGLITKLPPGNQSSSAESIRTSNKKVLSAFQKALGASGLGSMKIEEHISTIARFADEYLTAQSPARMLLDMTREDIEGYQKLRTDSINLVSFKRFVWFLRDTERIDWDDAERLLRAFKQR